MRCILYSTSCHLFYLQCFVFHTHMCMCYVQHVLTSNAMFPLHINIDWLSIPPPFSAIWATRPQYKCGACVCQVRSFLPSSSSLPSLISFFSPFLNILDVLPFFLDFRPQFLPWCPSFLPSSMSFLPSFLPWHPSSLPSCLQVPSRRCVLGGYFYIFLYMCVFVCVCVHLKCVWCVHYGGMCTHVCM